MGIDTQHQVDHILYVVRIEIIPYRVVVCGSRNDNEIGITVCGGTIQCSCQSQFLLCQVFLDILILDGRLPTVQLLHLLRYHVHRHNRMMLRQQSGDTQSHVTGSGHSDLDFFRHIVV